MAIESYQIIDFDRQSKNSYDKYYLELKNSKGKLLNYYVEFTAKYLHHQLKNECIPLDLLLDVEFEEILLSSTINAEIIHKTRGNEFSANKFTRPVTEDDGETWIEPIIGKRYLVYRTGYRINYDKPVFLKIDDNLVDRIIDKAEKRK